MMAPTSISPESPASTPNPTLPPSRGKGSSAVRRLVIGLVALLAVETVVAVLDTAFPPLSPSGGNLEGVRAASLAYFGYEPETLTDGEQAMLIALPQSPEARRPDRRPEAARAARRGVLDKMVRGRIITEAAASEADA